MSKTKPNQDPAYMGPDKGPFRCDNCEYFSEPNKCYKEEMIKAQDALKTAKVDKAGCCNYFETK
jgi:hypothetical protein